MSSKSALVNYPCSDFKDDGKSLEAICGSDGGKLYRGNALLHSVQNFSNNAKRVIKIVTIFLGWCQQFPWRRSNWTVFPQEITSFSLNIVSANFSNYVRPNSDQP